MHVKAFGGPAHGKRFDERNLRFEVHVRMEEQFRASSVFCGDDYQKPEFNDVTYYIHRYGDSRVAPRRHRELSVALMEGTELTRREHCELQREMQSVPWTVERASILDDFDQWFAEAAHRLANVLWWRYGPVHDR